MKLTEKVCREAKPGDVLVHDGEYGAGRLMLIVSPKGRRSFVFRQRAGGKNTTKVLGHHPNMGLSEAFAAARTFNDNTPDAAEQEAVGTLEQLLKVYETSLGDRPSARDARIQFALAFPKGDALLPRPANTITTGEVAAVLRRRAATGATTSVNRLRSGLHAAFSYAAKFDYDPRRPDAAATFSITTNPVAGTPRVAEWERAKTRVLTDDEIAAFLRGAAARGDAVGDLWQLVLMTGARLNQLVTADFSSDTLTITDTKGKGGRAKNCVLPVTPVMKPLMFRASLVHCCHIDTVRKAGAALMPEGATPSDVRRTVETRLQALGFSRELRGALLSHGNTGVQARHYEQDELLPQKLAALNAYHGTLKNILELSTPQPKSKE